MDGWFHAPDAMHCLVIQTKPLSASCECCAKAKCARSRAETSMCAEKQFVAMAIHRVQLNSRENCAYSLSTQERASKRRKLRGYEEQKRSWSRRALAQTGSKRGL